MSEVPEHASFQPPKPWKRRHGKSEKLTLQPIADTSKQFFVRIKGEAEALRAHLESKFGPIRIVQAESLDEEFGFLTEVMTEGEYAKCAEEFPGILHMIRVQE